MAAKKMPIGLFVKELQDALDRHDGYIMGATGQNPKNWASNSWWFTQYSGSQRTKALYWREHAKRVWDCNGMPEGIYKGYTGVDINTKARYNYSNWCNPKGSGTIPVKYRVPGAAVFWGNTAATITHVAYLERPVKADNPDGDWYIIEARGVNYGVVETKLSSRKPNYWGIMSKYFDYDGADKTELRLGDRILRNGDTGADVEEMQAALIGLGYDCGNFGADGDFGDATEIAVRTFQKDAGIDTDGEFGPMSHKALIAMIENAANDKPSDDTQPRVVNIINGNCYIRTQPNTKGAIVDIAHRGDKLPWAKETSDDGWQKVLYKGAEVWVSGKYSKLI